MTARLPCAATQDLARLLFAGYVFDDALTLDLYGTVDGGEHAIESVMIAGTQHNVTTLLSRSQIENMSAWLDVKDSAEPVLRDWAAIHKHRACKPAWGGTSANTVLQSVVAGMFPDPSDYELGLMRGHVLAAKHIGPADEKLLAEAMAVVDSFRPKRTA